ncbi:rubredoxin [Pseudomonas sp. MAFF 212408]|uniref:Rubredoxin n=1 Tax=Pseudomonas kitaguniensis TaxID=2607908 RepID=A0A5N7KJL8_9PSED|nr:rubredoxin [Pseudomonas kitaguniensis]MPR02407.1 rubredoxin [Pseudomonas kitaguniensis]
MKTYMCAPCGFMYVEELGIPEDGIPAGTPWEEVPEDWRCPDCGVTKADFMAIEL